MMSCVFPQICSKIVYKESNNKSNFFGGGDVDSRHMRQTDIDRKIWGYILVDFLKVSHFPPVF